MQTFPICLMGTPGPHSLMAASRQVNVTSQSDFALALTSPT